MELRPDVAQRIQEKVASGAYGSPDEVVNVALDALELEQDALERERQAIHEELDRRYDAIKSGQVEPVHGEEVFTRIRGRLDASQP